MEQAEEQQRICEVLHWVDPVLREVNTLWKKHLARRRELLDLMRPLVKELDEPRLRRLQNTDEQCDDTTKAAAFLLYWQRKAKLGYFRDLPTPQLTRLRDNLLIVANAVVPEQKESAK